MVERGDIIFFIRLSCPYVKRNSCLWCGRAPPQPEASLSKLLEVCSWLLLPQTSEPLIMECGDNQLMHAQDQCDLHDTLAVYDGKDGEEILNLAQGAQLLGCPLVAFHLLTVVS
jgi:hypothetical protein